MFAWNQHADLECYTLADEKSWCRLLEDLRKPVSSAKKEIKKDVQLGRSFIYSKKSIGPKTDPWGTPHKIFLRDDSNSPKFTYCVLFVK